MNTRLIRLLTVGVLWVAAAMFVRPEVVHAGGYCECSGYTYLYRADYTFVAQSSWGGSDPGASDPSYCFSECQYRGIYVEGGALCNAYGLNGGQGFVQTQFNWDYSGDGGPAGGYYDSIYDGQFWC